jgi:hypothetical protein
MRTRSLLLVLVAATALTLATSALPGHVTVNYADIDGCTAGCRVAAAGWPFPYLADYPGLSPSGSTSLAEAFTGSDHVLWTSFVLSWFAWAAVLGLATWLLRRRGRAPHKHKRHRH